MRPFSDDLRLRIHEARQAGESTAEVAERFGVSTAFVRRLQQRFRQTGSPGTPAARRRPRPQARRPRGATCAGPCASAPTPPRRSTASG